MIEVMLTTLLFLASSAWAAQFDEKWRICSTDADCVVTQGVCGEWTCVRTDKQKEAQDYFKAQMSSVECDKPKPAPKPTASCVRKKCSC